MKRAAQGPTLPPRNGAVEVADGCLEEALREAILLSLGDVQSWWLVMFRGGVHKEGGL